MFFSAHDTPLCWNPWAAFKWKWNGAACCDLHREEVTALSCIWGQGPRMVLLAAFFLPKWVFGVASVLFSVSVSDMTSCLPSLNRDRPRGLKNCLKQASLSRRQRMQLNYVRWLGLHSWIWAHFPAPVLISWKKTNFLLSKLWNKAFEPARTHQNPPTWAVCCRENNFAKLEISLCFQSN